jgi:hypothetical protein
VAAAVLTSSALTFRILALRDTIDQLERIES